MGNTTTKYTYGTFLTEMPSKNTHMVTRCKKKVTYKNIPRTFNCKQMRRNHQIKQPGFDVQRKR